MSETWPNTFVTGPGRSGTTSIYRYLGQHPEVFTSDIKEPGFFNETLDGIGDDERARREAVADYLGLFADAAGEPVVAEGTVGYVYSRPALERIAGTIDDPKLIVSHRDPIQRAYSQYWLAVSAGREPLDFGDAIEEELAAERAGKERRGYVSHSRIGTHLERLDELFGLDRVHAVSFERFIDDARPVLRETAAFLGIDVDAVEGIDTERVHNPTKGVPHNRLVHAIRSSDRVKSAARAILPKGVRDWLGNEVLLEDRDKPPIDPDVAARLADIFEPQVATVEELLGEDRPDLRASWPDR